MIKKTFSVKDMHCVNCAMKIEGLEDDLPGIQQVSASYRKLQVVVEYDEALIGETEIIEAINAKGYTATPK